MIRINYPETMRKAANIKDLSDNLRRLANEVAALTAETDTHWRGTAANAYLQQCDALKLYMEQTATAMNSVATKIQNVANAIKRADEEMARQAAALR